jgi:hypothetical protein
MKTPAQFDLLRADLMEQYQPQSVTESELVDRLAGLTWRLRRIPAFEAALIEARRAEVARDEVAVEDAQSDGLSDGAWSARKLGLALIEDGTYHDILGKLLVAGNGPVRQEQDERRRHILASVLARLGPKIAVERLYAARELCPDMVRSERFDPGCFARSGRHSVRRRSLRDSDARYRAGGH